MHVRHIQLKNFRCFKDVVVSFNNPLVVISGANGTGKTSLLEALYYACYARSFRTHNALELVRINAPSFFIKIGFGSDNEQHELQVGFADKKRLIKLDQHTVSTYKQLLDHYRVVTLTEDELELIKGAPEERRRFLDQATLLQDPEHVSDLKKLRHIVTARNALLKQGVIDKDSYQVWTEQLKTCSTLIQTRRILLLNDLERLVNTLLVQYISPDSSAGLEYIPKLYAPDLYEREVRFGRSFFGAHLDEFVIHFQEQKSRAFASRGQQKLLVILIKMAQIQLLAQKRGPCLVLLDDFMTDFDPYHAQALVKALIGLKCQLLFTAPGHLGSLERFFYELGAQELKIDSLN